MISMVSRNPYQSPSLHYLSLPAHVTTFTDPSPRAPVTTTRDRLQALLLKHPNARYVANALLCAQYDFVPMAETVTTPTSNIIGSVSVCRDATTLPATPFATSLHTESFWRSAHGYHSNIAKNSKQTGTNITVRCTNNYSTTSLWTILGEEAFCRQYLFLASIAHLSYLPIKLLNLNHLFLWSASALSQSRSSNAVHYRP
jgi:hypothetical protein